MQLQVNLSTNDDKVSPRSALLAAAVRPLAWEKHNGHPLNRQLYLPEYCLSRHDPSFGAHHGSAAGHGGTDELLGRGCPARRSAYVMEDMAHSTTANAAFAAAAAGCCGYPCWQAWMDLADLRAQIHDDCLCGSAGGAAHPRQRTRYGSGWACAGFGHDDAVMADYVLLTTPPQIPTAQ